MIIDLEQYKERLDKLLNKVDSKDYEDLFILVGRAWFSNSFGYKFPSLNYFDESIKKLEKKYKHKNN